MRTSRRLLKQVRQALIAAFLFSGFINLLMLALPLYILQLFEAVLPTSSVEMLAILTVMAAAAILTLAVLEGVRDRMTLRAGLWLDHTLGQHILANGLKLGLPAAEIRADQQALRIFKSALTGGVLIPLFDLPWVPVLLAGLALLHPAVGMTALIASALLILGVLAMAVLTRRLHTETNQAYERSQQLGSTVAANSWQTRALGLAAGAAEQWERCNRSQIKGAYSIGKRAGMLRVYARTIRTTAQIAIYGLGAWLVIRGELTPGALVAATLLMGSALAPLEQLVSSGVAIGDAYGAYKRLRDLAPDAVQPCADSGEHAPIGQIVVRDAVVVHPGRKTPALHGITLDLAPGEALGIIGPNGSGKSTLAALIAGALPPVSGAADIDGIPITKWQRSDGAPAVGYLPDDPLLIQGSVHDNIARFRDASLLSVARAAMRAGVHDELIELVNGYDTIVGPGGAGLALHERRAVAFARALHGDPAVLVLDEPELGLDGPGVQRLAGVLQQLKADGVSLVIATQDCRLIKHVDKVALLNGGAIARLGPNRDGAHGNGTGATGARRPPAAVAVAH